jgi:hypothetical protein
VQVISEGLTFTDKIKEMSMISLRLFRLITSNIYYEIIKNLAFKRPQIIHNLHINSKTLSLFDYKIGADDEKFDTLVVSAVLFCF